MNGIELPPPGDVHSFEHFQRWREQVSDGRVKTSSSTTHEQEMRHLRNALILRGRVG